MKRSKVIGHQITSQQAFFVIFQKKITPPLIEYDLNMVFVELSVVMCLAPAAPSIDAPLLSCDTLTPRHPHTQH